MTDMPDRIKQLKRAINAAMDSVDNSGGACADDRTSLIDAGLSLTSALSIIEGIESALTPSVDLRKLAEETATEVEDRTYLGDNEGIDIEQATSIILRALQSVAPDQLREATKMVVPAGFKLAPLEPTRKMILRGRAIMWSGIRPAYAAMLEAAPEPLKGCE